MATTYEPLHLAKAYAESGDVAEESKQKRQQTEKGQLEIDAYKKATADKEAYSKSVKDILSEQATPTTPEQTKEATDTSTEEPKLSPSGEPMPNFTAGTKPVENEWTGKLRDLQSAKQAESKVLAQKSGQLQKLMMAAANSDNPTLALEFRKQLDGLDGKQKEAQKESIELAGKQYEVQAQLGQGYLDNPTDEGWYNQVAESMRLGLPGAENLFNVPREKREAVAKAAIAQGLTANQQVKAQQAQANAIYKADAAKKKEEFWSWTRKFKERQQADRERVSSAREKREVSKQGDAQSKTYLASLQNLIKDTQYGVTSLEKERTGILGRIESIDKGTEFGLSEDAQAAKKKDLENQLKTVEGELTTAEADLRESNSEYRSVAKGKDKEVVAKPVKEDKKPVPSAADIKYVKDHPETKAAYEAHFGVKP